jgi:hypothetical protein
MRTFRLPPFGTVRDRAFQCVPIRRESIVARSVDKGADFTASACTPRAAVSSLICRDSCIVNTSTFVPFGFLRISLAASKPLKRGILTSRITRSGLSATTFWTASLPSIASPQTSHPAPSSAERRPLRTASWSSAIKMRNNFFPPAASLLTLVPPVVVPSLVPLRLSIPRSFHNVRLLGPCAGRAALPKTRSANYVACASPTYATIRTSL